MELLYRTPTVARLPPSLSAVCLNLHLLCHGPRAWAPGVRRTHHFESDRTFWSLGLTVCRVRFCRYSDSAVGRAEDYSEQDLESRIERVYDISSRTADVGGAEMPSRHGSTAGNERFRRFARRYGKLQGKQLVISCLAVGTSTIRRQAYFLLEKKVPFLSFLIYYKSQSVRG